MGATGTLNEVFVTTADASGDGECLYIAVSGEFNIGSWYQIDTVGTTDFTTIGAASNTVGVMFQATGTTPGGDGVAAVTWGARAGDMVATSVTDEADTEYQQLYVSLYNYQNRGTNREVLIESQDAFATLDTIVELSADGGDFGSTIADVVQRPGTTKLYMFHGTKSAIGDGWHKIISTSTDRGRTWTTTGSEMTLSPLGGSPRRNGMPVGKVVYLDSNKVVFSSPCSQDGADKPEVNMIFYAAWNDLDAGVDPTLWDFAPACIRPPNMSGIWNMDAIWMPDNTAYLVANSFGRDNFSSINTAAMNELREGDHYHEMGAGSHKHAMVARTINKLAIDDPTYVPFVPGDEVRISHLGRYLAAESTDVGCNLVLTEDASDPLTVFRPTKNGEVWWVFRLKENEDLALSTGGNLAYANNRAVGLPFEFRTWINQSTDDDDNFRFGVMLTGNDKPTVGYLQNARSSLAVARNCSQQPLLHGDASMLWSFEVIS